MYPSIVTEQTVTVIIDERPVSISGNEYNKAKELLKERNWEGIKELCNKVSLINKFSAGNISVKGTSVLYKNEPVNNYVVDKILQFIDEDIEAEPLMKFLDKMMENPSKQCVDRLYKFLEHKNMPIDSDGDFYAYKAIRSDWKDKYTGTIDNSVGQIVEVARNTVDDDFSRGCSYGLHAGSIQYVNSFASDDDKVVIVKINPADVVSVPNEDERKLRCCRYEVVAEFTNLLPDTVCQLKINEENNPTGEYQILELDWEEENCYDFLCDNEKHIC